MYISSETFSMPIALVAGETDLEVINRTAYTVIGSRELRDLAVCVGGAEALVGVAIDQDEDGIFGVVEKIDWCLARR